MQFQSRLALAVVVAAAILQGCQKDAAQSDPAETMPEGSGQLDPSQAALGGPLGSKIFFEPNQGQTDIRASFVGRGPGSQIFLVEDGVVLRSLGEGTQGSAIRLRFLDSKGGVFVGEAPLKAVSNYFLGVEESRWQRHVPRFAKVTQESLYPGVDVAYYGARDGSERLEFDLVVEAGAEPSAIRMRFEGGSVPSIDESGGLRIDTSAGPLRQLAPEAFQEISGNRVSVRAQYELQLDGSVSINLGPYSREHPVVVDPVLVYRTLIGGVVPPPPGSMTPEDRVLDIAIDGNGNTLGTGFSRTLDFPTTPGAFQEEFGGGVDAVVFKLDAHGDLTWATYLGGTGADVGYGLTADSSGIHVVGSTQSVNFALANPFQATLAGFEDAYVATLSSGGDALLFSTFLGGGAQDIATDVAVQPTGDLVVGGLTQAAFSNGFPVTQDAFDGEIGGGRDGFIARLRSGSLEYATFIGGFGTGGGGALDSVEGVAIDPSGNIVACGSTSSLDFPILNPPEPTTAPGIFSDAFVLKLDPTGTFLIFSTTLGGSGTEGASGCAVDSSGDVVVVGLADDGGSGFPLYAAFQPFMRGGSDAFVTKIASDGLQFRYSTYLGGDGDDVALGVAADDQGHAYVVGQTGTPNGVLSFPLRNALPASAFPGGSFLTRFDMSGNVLVYSTTLPGAGGRGLAVAEAVEVDSSHVAFVAGADWDETVQQLDAVVLKVGPVDTTITTGPSDTNDDTPAFTFISSEEESAFECAVDSAPFTPCASPFESAPLLAGSHVFDVRATTQYGDVDDTPARFEFSTAPGAEDIPETTIVAGPSGATNDASVTFEFTSNTLSATFECSLDSGPFEPCTSPHGLGPLTFGAHVFRVQAISIAGVFDPTPAERPFQVVPNTEILTAPPGRSALTTVSFEFTSNDTAASFQCSLGGPFEPCASPRSYAIAEGTHVFSVRALHGGSLIDPSPAAHAFVIDRSGPVLTLVSHPDGASTALTPLVATIGVNEEAVVTASSLFPSGTVLAPGTRTVSIPLRPGYNTFRRSSGTTSAIRRSSPSTFFGTRRRRPWSSSRLRTPRPRTTRRSMSWSRCRKT